jgi:DNA recombination protein RmuC
LESILITVAAVAVVVIAGVLYLKHSLGSLQQGTAGDEEQKAAQAEVIALRERLEAREADVKRLRGERDVLRTETKALVESHTSLNSQLAAAKEGLGRVPVLTQERDQSRAEFKGTREELSKLRAGYAELKTRQEEENKSADEKLRSLAESEKRLVEQFENLANRIFEEKHKKFSETSKESVENLLKPVKDQLEGFRKKVEDVYDKETRDRTSLFNEITSLKKLNEQMSADALNLTNALKGDNKAQGNWGEIQLERILEASGLIKGREYEVQVSAHNEEGKRYIPDVIVHLPEKKDVIVDSKVSLVAYDRYHSADSDEERQQAIKEHVASVRAHVNSLGEKGYEDLEGVNSLDFVIMFVPIDAALLLALEHDRDLTDTAFTKNVWLVSPMNLVGTLRIIYNIWRFEYQNRNAVEIATQAGRLHDKFVLFAESLQDVGRHIDRSQAAYDKAHKQLTTGSGNLVTRTQQLEKLGAKAKKRIPESLLHAAEDAQPLIESVDDDPVIDEIA